MKDDTWRRLETKFKEFPFARCEPVDASEINAAEAEVGIPLGDDYREFIGRYGGAIVGPYPIYGLRKAKPMGIGEESFVVMTKYYRGEKWPEVDKWVIFSSDHSGNPVGLDREGKVWLVDHDIGSVENIADDFEGYLRHTCLHLED